jgi:hypothetical protein
VPSENGIHRDQVGTKRKEKEPAGRLAFPGLAGGGGFGGVGDFAVFADHADKGLGGAGKAAVAAIDEAEFAPEVHALDVEELDVAGLDVVLGKTFADDGQAGIGGDEALDHADAGKFHSDVNAGAIWTEEFIEHLASEAGAGKDERLLGNVGESDLGALGDGILGADHEAKAVLVDVVHLEVGRLDGKSDDADVGGAIFDALKNLVTEVAVDADMDERIAALKLGKDIGEKIKAGGFIGAENNGPLNYVAAVGDQLNGFVAEAKKLFRVLEENLAGGSEFDGFGGAIEELGFVGLFELANLGADGGLRAKNFLASAREAFELGDVDKSGELIEVHSQEVRQGL